MSYSVNKSETVEAINDCYNKYNYLIDPHTAVGYKAYDVLKDKLIGKTVVVSTASPFKFVETVNEVFNFKETDLELINKIAGVANLEVPSILSDIYNFEYEKVVWKKEEMETNLRKLIGEIDENC